MFYEDIFVQAQYKLLGCLCNLQTEAEAVIH